MNKKEISIIATEEQKAYLRLKKFRQTARYFYNLAVKKRREGDVKNAKLMKKPLLKLIITLLRM